MSKAITVQGATRDMTDSAISAYNGATYRLGRILAMPNGPERARWLPIAERTSREAERTLIESVLAFNDLPPDAPEANAGIRWGSTLYAVLKAPDSPPRLLVTDLDTPCDLADPPTRIGQ